MKRKKILIDTYHLMHATTGLRTYTLQLCKGLAAYKSTVNHEYVFAPDWRRTSSSTIFHGRLSLTKKILHHISTFLWKQLVLPIWAFAYRSDVVIVTDFVAPVWKPGFRVFVVFHDVFFWELKGHYQPLWRAYYTRMAEMGILSKATIVATSQYTKSKIENWIKPSAPVVVIYQSYKPMTLDTNQYTDFLTRFGLETKQYFLHVGYFDKRKNIPLLLDAYAEFLNKTRRSEIRLVLVGDRAASVFLDDYPAITTKIKEHQLENQVILTGFLSEVDLQSAYKNAIGLVFPSYDEGFGIPVLEAFAAGIPVIVSDRGATSEIGGDAVLVCKWDAKEDFSNRMADMLELSIKQKLVNAGNERLDFFSLVNFTDNWDKLILNEE